MTDRMTEQCDHGKGENIHPPIYWNPFNKVYQCHKCGRVFVPDQALEDERAKIKENMTKEKFYGKSELDQPRFSALDAQEILNENKTLKVELEDERAKAKGLVEALNAMENRGSSCGVCNCWEIAKEALARYREE